MSSVPKMLPLLAALGGIAPSAVAQAEESAEELVVWGDLFARWDDTRWHVATEIVLPFDLWLHKDENLSFSTRALQVRTVVACSKQWKLTRKRWEVDCEIEDVALQASVRENEKRERPLENARAVLDEIDAKLTGAKLQLHVADDGRVTDLDLEGVPKNNRRQSEIHQTLSLVMSRVIVGFNLKLRKWNQLHEGKWVEYNSTLMSMPVVGNMGSNMLVHYLNDYKGQLLVQSVGKGVVQLDQGGRQLHYTTELIGVSIFDRNDGFMTERVWALEGKGTASNLFDSGNYFHAGRIAMLGTGDKPDVGPTRVVNAPQEHWPGLPDWEPIER